MRPIPLGLLVASVIAMTSCPAEAQWGSLKGKVILNGNIPDVKLLVTKGDQTVRDPAVCAAKDIPDESLAIDPKSKGIAHVAIWLSKKPVKIHPNLAKPAAAQITFDQVGCRFTPHVMVVQTGQTVNVVSGDAIAHNTRGNPLRPGNKAFNFVVAANNRIGDKVDLKAAENVPMTVFCDYHRWMKAHWLVVNHPYATITNEQGEFEIKDLPVGEFDFKIWHENQGYVKKHPSDPKKGGLVAVIKDGETTELPDIKVPFTKLQVK